MRLSLRLLFASKNDFRFEIKKQSTAIVLLDSRHIFSRVFSSSEFIVAITII